MTNSETIKAIESELHAEVKEKEAKHEVVN